MKCQQQSATVSNSVTDSLLPLGGALYLGMCIHNYEICKDTYIVHSCYERSYFSLFKDMFDILISRES